MEMALDVKIVSLSLTLPQAVWVSSAAATRSQSTQLYRKIGLTSVCDTVSRTLFITLQSRIQTAVPEVSPCWNWMESR